MTAVTDLLDRFRALGFELTPDGPDIRVEYPAPEPPPETPALLDALRLQKSEALRLLAAGDTWDEAAERARLDGAYDSCDEIAGTVPSWPDAWTWTRSERPDLVAAVDAAFDRIDDAFRAEDPIAHADACRSLVEAVRAAAAAFQADAHTWPTGERLEVRDGRVFRVDAWTGDRIEVDEDGDDR